MRKVHVWQKTIVLRVRLTQKTWATQKLRLRVWHVYAKDNLRVRFPTGLRVRLSVDLPNVKMFCVKVF